MAGALSMTDDEKTMMELQDRLMVGTQSMSKLANAERLATNRKIRTELTLKELEPLPNSTRMYKSVGKAYFLSTQGELVEEAKELVSECSKELDSLRVQKAVVEKKMKETENELKELVNTSPHIIKQLAGLRTR